MDRSIRHLVLLFLVPSAGLSCLVGVGIGLWSLLDQSGSGGMLLRGGLALLGVLIVSLVPALVLATVFSRRTGSLQEIAQALAAKRAPEEPIPDGPAEFAELAADLCALGKTLEKDRKDSVSDHVIDSRRSREEALRRFSEGVAREVQKSLAGVVGFAEMALRQPGVDGQLKNYLTLIEQEARSGRDALGRILRYGRDEPFATEPLDLNEILVETSRSLVASKDNDQIQLSMNLSQDLPKVFGDAGQLMQVFTTLIDNAREAMVEKGGTIELSTNKEPSGSVVVMVRDSGRGISAEQQERVFTPFFTSKGNLKGAGMSLALADSIVRRHFGHIDFFSNPGEGTVFFVHLPPEGKAPNDETQ